MLADTNVKSTVSIFCWISGLSAKLFMHTCMSASSSSALPRCRSLAEADREPAIHALSASTAGVATNSSGDLSRTKSWCAIHRGADREAILAE